MSWKKLSKSRFEDIAGNFQLVKTRHRAAFWFQHLYLPIPTTLTAVQLCLWCPKWATNWARVWAETTRASPNPSRPRFRSTRRVWVMIRAPLKLTYTRLSKERKFVGTERYSIFSRDFSGLLDWAGFFIGAFKTNSPSFLYELATNKEETNLCSLGGDLRVISGFFILIGYWRNCNFYQTVSLITKHSIKSAFQNRGVYCYRNFFTKR